MNIVLEDTKEFGAGNAEPQPIGTTVRFVFCYGWSTWLVTALLLSALCAVYETGYPRQQHRDDRVFGKDHVDRWCKH